MNSPLMLLSGIPVELPLLFDQGYSFFYNSSGASKARARVSKQKQTKHTGNRQNGNRDFNDYRNYMDQVKGSNPDLSNLTTHLMKGLGQRVERYYTRYQSIPQSVFNVWKHKNMPYVILSSTKVDSIKTVIKLHLSEITREKLDYELNRGMIVRLTELPKDFSLLGYEVYGNGSVENDAILGDVKLLDKIGSTDILARTFNKRDRSEYAGSEGLGWLAELESLVNGTVIDTTNVRKSKPIVSATSYWYSVKVSIAKNDKGDVRIYKGMLLSYDMIKETPIKLSRKQDFNFLHNFIPTEAVTIELPETIKKEGFVVEILEAKLSSAAIKGLVGYGVTTLTLDPGRMYYLIGKKGSGKSTKIKLLQELGNVEDSDDYGVFLTWYLGREGKLQITFDELIEWIPSGDSFAKAVNEFMLRSHDYDNEKSLFLLFAEVILDGPIAPEVKTRRLITYINYVMAHPFIGVQRYSDLRSQHYDMTKPTFVMCHSTAETGFRRTPDDTIALSEVINSEKIVGARDRSSKSSDNSDDAELLLYYAYAEGISTINKLLPFAIILEQLRCVSADPLFGALRIRTEDEILDSNVQ